MTMAGWLIFAVLTFFIVGTGVLIGYDQGSDFGMFIGVVVGLIVSGLVLGIMMWYFGNTASGKRAIKTQRSDFDDGLKRTISVYDIEGDLIKEYSGKFDIGYDGNKILFDDENNKRHIIYYPTGTVIIDEIGE